MIKYNHIRSLLWHLRVPLFRTIYIFVGMATTNDKEKLIFYSTCSEHFAQNLIKHFVVNSLIFSILEIRLNLCLSSLIWTQHKIADGGDRNRAVTFIFNPRQLFLAICTFWTKEGRTRYKMERVVVNVKHRSSRFLPGSSKYYKCRGALPADWKSNVDFWIPSLCPSFAHWDIPCETPSDDWDMCSACPLIGQLVATLVSDWLMITGAGMR